MINITEKSRIFLRCPMLPTLSPEKTTDIAHASKNNNMGISSSVLSGRKTLLVSTTTTQRINSKERAICEKAIENVEVKIKIDVNSVMTLKRKGHSTSE